jgi:hypothetical protein
MFDYQAGEKYKLTLIMVGAAGVMAGAFFTLLLSPPAEPPHKDRRATKISNDPDMNGTPRMPHGRGMRDNGVPRYPDGTPMSSAPPQATADKTESKNLVMTMLPLAFDFNSTSANRSQELAMAYMTPECANNYRTSVWTPEIAQSVAGAAMTSSFNTTVCEPYTSTEDGSVVIKVEGEQVLVLQGQQRPKHVSMEILVKKTNQGLKVAGISDTAT